MFYRRLENINGLDTVYLWKLNDKGELTMHTLVKTDRSYGKGQVFRNRDTRKIERYTSDDLEVFKNNRVVSRSYDKNYILGLIRTALLCKKQEAKNKYMAADAKLELFLKENGLNVV